MIRLESFDGIYLHRAPVDFRKSIDGLSQIVQSEMKLDVFQRFLFLFCNKDRDRMKILYWDRTGFALWLKRLEKARFPWPRKDEREVIEMNASQMRLLLEGYEFWKLKPHETLHYSAVL